MDINTHLKLKNNVSVIGSVSDFTYKWSLNGGLAEDDALRFTLAVNELVTDVVLFAFGEEEGEFEIHYSWSPSKLEVILNELGEPFDPERHQYDRERALKDGNFEGAGFELIKHLVDDFIFLNKGKAGKEFRLVKNTSTEHIADIIIPRELKRQPAPHPQLTYQYAVITTQDAEDIAKLIYRTYHYTYIKEDLYYPKKIELTLERGDKFGVIARTPEGEAVGYFAVLMTTDSMIGEVGEAVVSVQHRRRGIMTHMLHSLIDTSRKKGLLGLFGEAVTVHTISQKANHRFGFKSTALLLNTFPAAKYKGLNETYSQDISIIIDYLPLQQEPDLARYLPDEYADLITEIYESLELRVIPMPLPKVHFEEASELDLKISFEYKHALFTVKQYGEDFIDRLSGQLHTLQEKDIHAIYIDLPLNDPITKLMVRELRASGFVFSGLMPRFHQEMDYLRLQHVPGLLDFEQIHVYSELAQKIKRTIADELKCNTLEKITD